MSSQTAGKRERQLENENSLAMEKKLDAYAKVKGLLLRWEGNVAHFWTNEWKALAAMGAVFLTFYYLPMGSERFKNAVLESLYLAKWYAQEHVLLCLIPAFFIAGAISVFVSQASVMKYSRSRREQGISLWGRFGLRVHLGSLFLHGLTAFCRHPPDGSGARTGDGISLLRSRDQRAGHSTHGPRSRARAWSGPGHRGHCF